MRLRVIHGWRGLDAADRGAAVALGNFDGVHRGHQQVIAQAAAAAGRLHAPLGVVTFEPHPRRWFQPEAESFRLMTLDQQARALDDLGVDRLHLIAFDAELAGMDDRRFALEVLHGGLGVRHVAVGFDITFGKGRTGDPQSMAAYGAEAGFGVSVAAAVGAGEAKYSSSAVRAALREGRPEVAAAILGRPFALEGVVERGQQLGRKLGYPTANVPLRDYVLPRLGVYATRTRLPDGRELPGVANLGENPTTGRVQARLEVWLYDFDEDIYGQTLETDLIAFLRPEEHFDGLPALIAQIRDDVEQARSILLPPL